jgi:hypothetical protein
MLAITYAKRLYPEGGNVLKLGFEPPFHIPPQPAGGANSIDAKLWLYEVNQTRQKQDRYITEIKPAMTGLIISSLCRESLILIKTNPL